MGSPGLLNLGCLLCGATDKPITGTVQNRHCTNTIGCAERVRQNGATSTRPTAAAQSKPSSVTPMRPYTAAGAHKRETTAEVLISMLQQRAGVHELSGPMEYGESLRLPIGALQGRYVCFGKSGCGKSNASTVAIENALANNVPVAALDTMGNLWGIRHAGTRAGQPIAIIGGAHGDLALSVDDGVMLANIFARGTSMLIDLSDLTRDDQQAFGTAFFRELLRVLRRPAHVVVEEAETLCPAFTRSKTHFASQGAISLFARQIRNYGGGWTFSTHRLPLLHPDVVDASNAFLAMQTTGDGAQRKIEYEARTRVGRVVASAILDELGQLPTGYAWLVPDASLLGTEVGAPVRFRFRERWTFDSTAVPKIGEPLPVPGKRVAVDLRPFKALQDAQKARE